MKTLSLLRHAKALRDLPGIQDFDRPLAPRGIEAAPMIGRHMREQGYRPDLVLCSPALRTRQTAALVLEALGPPAPPLTFEPAIYEASAATLLGCIQRADPVAAHVLMIGHNPGFEDLARLVAGGQIAEDHAAIRVKFPTAALAVIALDIAAWEETREDCGRIVHFTTPRSLGQRPMSG
ncbi:MAG: histidine phosphatase family protein [Proteobacteria bacterium]|nr:histidine phosphatase family protein [Pseudomonadota bacterium]